MSVVARAMCCTPGPLWNSRYSSICDFLFPWAGSLIGNLSRPLPSVTTFDISAEYSVEISSSEKWIISVIPNTRS